MQIKQCSASAIKLYENCSFAYFLHYILGLKSKAGKAALQGTIVHKALEWMAKLKRKGKTNVDPMWLLDRAWEESVVECPEVAIRKVTTRIDKETGNLKEAADFKKCRIAMETVLADEFYNPYNLSPLETEQWFAMELPGKEWECLDKDGGKHQFAVRGFIDLVHEIDSDTIEIIDWKTGVREDLSTREPIDESSLARSIQPRLYHLVAYFLYPQCKNILITFYFTNSGGPITISLSHDDIPVTLGILGRFFRTVKKDTLIQRNRRWTCRMCPYDKGGVCDRIWSDLHVFGSEYIQVKYGEQ